MIIQLLLLGHPSPLNKTHKHKYIETGFRSTPYVKGKMSLRIVKRNACAELLNYPKSIFE